MHRIWDLFRYNPEIDYEDEFSKSSYTEELCNKVVPSIVQDHYASLTSKRFDFIVSYTDEFKDELFDQVKSAAKTFKEAVDSNASLSDTQRRHSINWASMYEDLVKRSIESSIIKLYQKISSYPQKGQTDCLYYNFWGEKFIVYKHESMAVLGANDEQRASFDREYNEKLFDSKYADLKAELFQSYAMQSMIPDGDYGTCIKKVRPFFQDLFQDYIQRFSAESLSLTDIENAGLGWIYFTFKRCDMLEKWEYWDKKFSTQVTKVILSEMQKNFIADIERKLASEVPAKKAEPEEDTMDVFRKLEEKRDTQIRRKVEESVLSSHAKGSTGLTRGRIYFNLWGKEYYQYAAPLFKVKPLPEAQKPLIDRVSNANYFSEKLVAALSGLDISKDVNKSPKVSECKEHLILMMNDYMDFVATKEGIYADTFVKEGICWNDAADYAVSRAVNRILSQKEDADPEFVSYMYTVGQCLKAPIRGAFPVLITDHAKLYGWKIDFVMPYNMVGQDFYERTAQASGRVIPSRTDARFIEYHDNASIFMSFMFTIFKEVTDKGEKGEEYESEIKEYVDWFKSVSADYINRLKESYQEDPRSYAAQASLWSWNTNSIISLVVNDYVEKLEAKVAAVSDTSDTMYTKLEGELESAKEFRNQMTLAMMEIGDALNAATYAILCGKIDEVRNNKTDAERTNTKSAVKVITERADKDSVANTTAPQEVMVSETCYLQFYDGISNERQSAIRRYLHKHITATPGVEEFLVLKAAIDLNFIKYPSFKDFKAEFSVQPSCNRNFSNYFGVSGKFYNELSSQHQRKVDQYSDELTSLLKEIE